MKFIAVVVVHQGEWLAPSTEVYDLETVGPASMLESARTFTARLADNRYERVTLVGAYPAINKVVEPEDFHPRL